MHNAPKADGRIIRAPEDYRQNRLPWEQCKVFRKSCKPRVAPPQQRSRTTVSNGEIRDRLIALFESSVTAAADPAQQAGVARVGAEIVELRVSSDCIDMTASSGCLLQSRERSIRAYMGDLIAVSLELDRG